MSDETGHRRQVKATQLTLTAVFLALIWFLPLPSLSAINGPSTRAVDLEVVSDLNISPESPGSGETVRASFAVRNSGSEPVHLERLTAGGRGPGCEDWACQKYGDFPFHSDITIQPGATYTYNEERVFYEEGEYFVQIAYELTPGAWSLLGRRILFNVTTGLRILDALQLTPRTPHSAELVFADFTLVNLGAATQSYAKVGVAARGPDCQELEMACMKIVDYVYDESVNLGPGDTFRFHGSRVFAEPGSYFAQIAVQDQSGFWHQLGSPTVFAVKKAEDLPRTSKWKFGVHFHPQWHEEDFVRLGLAQSVGAEVVRIGASWQHLEPREKGAWDYNWYIPALDERITRANALGIDVYMLLLQVPCWASSDTNKNCATNTWDDAYPPVDFEDYADAYRKLIELYGDRVDVWEVWNEPNSERFWKPAPDPLAYTSLLKKTYPAIKAENPNATVLGGSLAGADTFFLDSMYGAGAKGYFDALSLHPYSGGAPDDCSFGQWTFKCGVEGVRSMMVHHNDPQEIWITEFGWSSFSQTPGVGEKRQAIYLQEALDIVEYWEYVPVVTWYNLVDSAFQIPGLEHEDYMGLFDRSYRAKPAAEWLRDLYYPSENYIPVIQADS